MSRKTDLPRIEVHLHAATQDESDVKLLTAVAHYHQTETLLNIRPTVNFGRPWRPGSPGTHGLLSLPYLDGPQLEYLQLDRLAVRFLWLIPLTTSGVFL